MPKRGGAVPLDVILGIGNKTTKFIHWDFSELNPQANNSVFRFGSTGDDTDIFYNHNDNSFEIESRRNFDNRRSVTTLHKQNFPFEQRYYGSSGVERSRIRHYLTDWYSAFDRKSFNEEGFYMSRIWDEMGSSDLAGFHNIWTDIKNLEGQQISYDRRFGVGGGYADDPFDSLGGPSQPRFPWDKPWWRFWGGLDIFANEFHMLWGRDTIAQQDTATWVNDGTAQMNPKLTFNSPVSLVALANDTTGTANESQAWVAVSSTIQMAQAVLSNFNAVYLGTLLVDGVDYSIDLSTGLLTVLSTATAPEAGSVGFFYNYVVTQHSIDYHTGILSMPGTITGSQQIQRDYYSNTQGFKVTRDGDTEFYAATRGPILTDRTTGVRYRQYVNNGALLVEAV